MCVDCVNLSILRGVPPYPPPSPLLCMQNQLDLECWKPFKLVLTKIRELTNLSPFTSPTIFWGVVPGVPTIRRTKSQSKNGNGAGSGSFSIFSVNFVDFFLLDNNNVLCKISLSYKYFFL